MSPDRCRRANLPQQRYIESSAVERSISYTPAERRVKMTSRWWSSIRMSHFAIESEQISAWWCLSSSDRLISLEWTFFFLGYARLVLDDHSATQGRQWKANASTLTESSVINRCGDESFDWSRCQWKFSCLSVRQGPSVLFSVDRERLVGATSSASVYQQSIIFWPIESFIFQGWIRISFSLPFFFPLQPVDWPLSRLD